MCSYSKSDRFNSLAGSSALIYEEFQELLSKLSVQYDNLPRQEMVRLLLIALEREELVSVGYRESAIRRRVEKMNVPSEMKEIIRHALLWVWKDEEMHAIFVRGALIKVGDLPLQVRALSHQILGAIEGWSSSVSHHVSWSQAPASRLLAGAVMAVGAIAGKIPQSIKTHLEYGSFRKFCLFNVEAERTAWLCWNRLVELVQTFPATSADMLDDFKRILVDEDNHRRVFQILADALTEEDTMASGVSPQMVMEQVANVGDFFLPRRLRKGAAEDNPLGVGGAVYVCTGENRSEKTDAFRLVLEQSGLTHDIAHRAEYLKKNVSDLSIIIKPSFMLGYHRSDMSNVSDPGLVHELARFVHELGCRKISVIEGRNSYNSIYANRGVREVAKYFGFVSPYYNVVDASLEQVHHHYSRGMAQYTVAKSWKDSDYRISFGKLRSHPTEALYLTLGNIQWIGSSCDEFIFLERQAKLETASIMVASEFPPHFAVLDAYDMIPDGVVGLMGCAHPKSPLRFYAGKDALALDLVAARHVGLKNPELSSLLRTACHWFGNPSDDTMVIGKDKPILDWRGPYTDEVATLLSLVAYPVYEFGSFRGKLFVPEFDEIAFPPLKPTSNAIRLARTLIQCILGLKGITK